jgi:hypothetical protein
MRYLNLFELGLDQHKKCRHKEQEAASLSTVSQRLLLGQPGGAHLEESVVNVAGYDHYEGDHGDNDALNIKGSHQREYQYH